MAAIVKSERSKNPSCESLSLEHQTAVPTAPFSPPPRSHPPSYTTEEVQSLMTGRRIHATRQMTPDSRASSFEAWPPQISETVAACGTNGRSILSVHVNGKKLDSLLDTGSAITLISAEWAEKLKLNLQQATITAKTVNGESLPIVAKTEISISVAETVEKQCAYVLRNAPFPLILGVDFMRRVGKFSIDYSRGQAEINGRTVPLAGPGDIQNPRLVKVIEAIQI